LQVSKLHACLEATGVYGEAIALFLHERGHLISVVNPLRIKGYAQSNMQRNKIDRLDSQTEVKQLQSLVRRVEVLEEMLQAEENRLANAAAEIKPSIERIIGLLKEEICAPGAANQTTY
jgi:transposase